MPSNKVILNQFGGSLGRSPCGSVIVIDRPLFELAFYELEKLLQKEEKECPPQKNASEPS